MAFVLQGIRKVKCECVAIYKEAPTSGFCDCKWSDVKSNGTRME